MLAKLFAAIRWLAYFIFWLGLAVGTYTRWVHLPESQWILLIALLTSTSTLIFLLSTLRRSSSCLLMINRFTLSFNPAFLLGCLAFTQTQVMKKDYYEIIYNTVLLLSLIIYFTWAAATFSMVSPTLPSIIDSSELYALAGVYSATFILSERSSIGILSSLLFVGLTIFSLYRKNLIILMLLPLYILLNATTILGIDDPINRESLCIFILILLLVPLSSVFISPTTALKSWEPLMGTRLIILRLVTLLIICLESVLIFLTGHSLTAHKEWWVVMPLFAACAILLWLPLHFVYFLVHWKLWSRLKAAIDILASDPSRSLPHILSSRGVRHFSLISYPLMWCNLMVTILQFVWSWTTQNSITCGLVLICLPLQVIHIGLLRVLSRRLGGTCCAYALVTPSVIRSKDDLNMREVQTSTSYATRTIRLVQEFFTHHLLADGGCEYLSDRMTETSLHYKLETFFNMKTEEGEHFDSYLLYYSGPVTDSGDWILKGDDALTYAKLITWWTNMEVSKTSRLLLVLDTAKSNYWVSHVRRTSIAHVGIQTLFVRKEAAALQEFCIGDFSRDWIDFNCNKDSEVYSETFQSPIVVTYGLSQYWASFRFHEPSIDEMERHWMENFSVQMKPLIQLYTLFGSKYSCCCLCSCISHCFSTMRMWLWPPNQLDIGHGFKFVRFFNLPNSGIL